MAKTSLNPARLASLAEEWRDVAQRAVDTLPYALEGIGGYDHPNTRFWRITPALAKAAGDLDGETLTDLCNELLRPNDPPRSDCRQFVETLWKRCQPILDSLQVNPPDGDAPSASKETLALATLAHHPEWTDTAIAAAVGCNRTSLYRWKQYKQAREILEQGKHNLPHGSKAKDGMLEAWDT